jgi:hypothetical protein
MENRKTRSAGSLLWVNVEEAIDGESKHEEHTSIGRLSKPMEEDILETGGERKAWWCCSNVLVGT